MATGEGDHSLKVVGTYICVDKLAGVFLITNVSLAIYIHAERNVVIFLIITT